MMIITIKRDCNGLMWKLILLIIYKRIWGSRGKKEQREDKNGNSDSHTDAIVTCCR